jgi:hypothetical protein
MAYVWTIGVDGRTGVAPAADDADGERGAEAARRPGCEREFPLLLPKLPFVVGRNLWFFGRGVGVRFAFVPFLLRGFVLRSWLFLGFAIRHWWWRLSWQRPSFGFLFL